MFRSLSAIFFLIALLGMAGPARSAGSVSSNKEIDSLVEEALTEIEFDYASRSFGNILGLMDDDFENLLSFKSSLEDYFLGVKELQIHFVVDTVLADKNSVSARLHWFKKAIDNAGAFSKNKGSSQFVFRKSGRVLKLLYIRGDNPFF